MKSQVVALLGIVILMCSALVGCGRVSSEKNTLATHLGQPLTDTIALVDNHTVVSVVQDGRLGEVPREAHSVGVNEDGWIVSAICADTPALAAGNTQYLGLSVIRSEFLTEATLDEVRAGKMQDGRECGNQSPLGPE